MDKKTFIIVIVCVAILLFSSLLYTNIRFDKQLNRLSESINSSKESTDRLGAGIRQQNQVISDLAGVQQQLEVINDKFTGVQQQFDSISNELADLAVRTSNILNQLEDSESIVDGYTGAVKGTIDNISRTINLTLQGIKEEGVSE